MQLGDDFDEALEQGHWEALPGKAGHLEASSSDSTPPPPVGSPVGTGERATKRQRLRRNITPLCTSPRTEGIPAESPAAANRAPVQQSVYRDFNPDPDGGRESWEGLHLWCRKILGMLMFHLGPQHGFNLNAAFEGVRDGR